VLDLDVRGQDEDRDLLLHAVVKVVLEPAPSLSPAATIRARGDEPGARPNPHFDASDPRACRRRQAEAPQRSNR
jgi:hypothetical protein